MAVMKATISFDVFFDEEEASRFNASSLEDVLYEVDEGGWISSSPTKTIPQAVAPEHLQAEMEAIGNDGSFFDRSYEEAIERRHIP